MSALSVLSLINFTTIFKGKTKRDADLYVKNCEFNFIFLFSPTEKVEDKEHCGAEQKNILQGWTRRFQINLFPHFIYLEEDELNLPQNVGHNTFFWDIFRKKRKNLKSK